MVLNLVLDHHAIMRTTTDESDDDLFHPRAGTWRWRLITYTLASAAIAPSFLRLNLEKVTAR
jgi:hypothetical protein